MVMVDYIYEYAVLYNNRRYDDAMMIMTSWCDVRGRQFAVRDLITADVVHETSHLKYFKSPAGRSNCKGVRDCT